MEKINLNIPLCFGVFHFESAAGHQNDTRPCRNYLQYCSGLCCEFTYQISASELRCGLNAGDRRELLTAWQRCQKICTPGQTKFLKEFGLRREIKWN